jgi:hypothetical protein
MYGKCEHHLYQVKKPFASLSKKINKIVSQLEIRIVHRQNHEAHTTTLPVADRGALSIGDCQVG